MHGLIEMKAFSLIKIWTYNSAGLEAVQDSCLSQNHFTHIRWIPATSKC